MLSTIENPPARRTRLEEVVFNRGLLDRSQIVGQAERLPYNRSNTDVNTTRFMFMKKDFYLF